MSPSATNGERKSVEALAEEFLDRKRRGEPTTVEDYAQAHPELADEILAFFPALLTMETLGGDASSRTSAITSVAESPVGGGTPPVRLGEYRILREIGRGGMGVVYEAEQESLGRRVALKVLPGCLLADAKQVRRFQREARSAARLHHTNIVPVFGVGEHDGTHFYVMQFIEGQGLDVILEELRQLRTARSHQAAGPGTVRQTPEGPEAADRASVTGPGPVRRRSRRRPADRPRRRTDAVRRVPGAPRSRAPAVGIGDAEPGDPIQHLPAFRDRPQLRRGRGADRRPGCRCPGLCARARASSIATSSRRTCSWIETATSGSPTSAWPRPPTADDVTHTGDIVGTVRYMAPERFSGFADARSDLYALGLTLYELLALRPAFQERDRASLIHQVTHEDPPRLRKLNSRVPLDLETIVHKAMAREPGRAVRDSRRPGR